MSCKHCTDPNGVDRHTTEIVAREMKVLDTKQGGSSSNGTRNSSAWCRKIRCRFSWAG